MAKLLSSAVMILTLGMSGCMPGTIGHVATMSAEQLRAEPTANVAAAYGARLFYGSDDLEGELRRRDAFTADQWSMIEQRQIAVGAPKELVLASWGSPSRTREYTDAGGSRQLWVYDHHSHHRGYVWISGGRVAAIEQ